MDDRFSIDALTSFALASTRDDWRMLPGLARPEGSFPHPHVGAAIHRRDVRLSVAWGAQARNGLPSDMSWVTRALLVRAGGPPRGAVVADLLWSGQPVVRVHGVELGPPPTRAGDPVPPPSVYMPYPYNDPPAGDVINHALHFEVDHAQLWGLVHSLRFKWEWPEHLADTQLPVRGSAPGFPGRQA